MQSQVQSSLCPSGSGAVTNDGDDVPPVWRYESYRQITIVDGVVLRTAHGAGHCAPRIQRAGGDKRGCTRQFYEAVAFHQKFLWSDVSFRLLADLRAIASFW